MIPILFDSAETQFQTNGIGHVTDAVSCYVDQEVNGIVELEMQYPVSGKRYGALQMRAILLTKSDRFSCPQPFRIYRITKPMGGLVKVYARHIAYDLMGIPVSPFHAGNARDAMARLKENAAVACPFSFWTDKETTATMDVTEPKAAWSLLGGSEGSALDVYGGEYEFDRFTVRLHKRRGMDRGVTIRYGKNLTSLEQDENCASVYTGVYPYWKNTEGMLISLPEKIVPADGTFDHVRVLPLDLSSDFEEAPAQEQLRARAESYMRANEIGVPKISWSVSFVQLAQTEEYRDRALLEEIHLGDTVTVIFPKMGIHVAARAVKTRYNVLLDRYENVTLGRVKANIADTIAGNSAKIYLESVQRKDEVRKINAELVVHEGKIDAKVEKVGGDPESFSWEMLYNGFTFRSSGEDVMRIYKGGVEVVGKIIAKTGHIGPYDILENCLSSNGMTWDSAQTQGIYHGPEGFKMGGGFRVDITGRLYAREGVFEGNVYAKNIQYGGDYGTYNGAGITSRTVTGSTVGYNTISTINTSGGINTSLGYADFSNSVFNGWDTAANIYANYITATSGLYIPYGGGTRRVGVDTVTIDGHVYNILTI